MLWPREEFHTAYGQIKHDGIKTGACSILILAALDVDALCACEILTTLLKRDFLSYTLLAVKGYEDVKRIKKERIIDEMGNVKNPDLKSIIMINCGAIVNVVELLQLPESMKCYIFDSHRPIHLANIYDASRQVIVFDDGAQSIDEFPADGSDIENDEFDDESEEEDEDEEAFSDEEEPQGEEDIEGEAEFGEEQEEEQEEDKENILSSDQASGKRKRSSSMDSNSSHDPLSSKSTQQKKTLRLGSSSQLFDDDIDIEEDQQEENDQEAAEKEDQMVTSTSQDFDELYVDKDIHSSSKAAKQQRRAEILNYYRGSFYGAPAATIAFELAQQMNASNSDLLWFAIVGLTKQFLQEEIDIDNYNMLIHRFQDEALTLDSSNGIEQGMDNNNHSSNSSSSSSHLIPLMEDGKIEFEEEYRFMLYRHWSLYESMYYSNYIAAKLGLWQSASSTSSSGLFTTRSGQSNHLLMASGKGREEELDVFLARMGFSLKQTQQKFQYMPYELKQNLKSKITEIAPEFGLEDLFYGSFRRSFAFKYQLCAADAVYGLRALLEAPESLLYRIVQEEIAHGTAIKKQELSSHAMTSLFTRPPLMMTTIGSKKTEDKEEEDDQQQQQEFLQNENRFWQQNFLLAHNAIGCKSIMSSTLMESGIQLSMELKKQIVQVGMSIVERRLIMRVKHFRYVCLNLPEKEQEIFSNAAILSQLALFLIHLHRANGKWTHQKKKNAQQEEDDDLINTIDQKPIVPLVLITKNPTTKCFLVVGATCPRQEGEVHRNTLGTAFKLAAGETGANFRQDGFETAIMEIQMEDIHYFVEQLHNVLDA